MGTNCSPIPPPPHSTSTLFNINITNTYFSNIQTICKHYAWWTSYTTHPAPTGILLSAEIRYAYWKTQNQSVLCWCWLFPQSSNITNFNYPAPWTQYHKSIQHSAYTFTSITTTVSSETTLSIDHTAHSWHRQILSAPAVLHYTTIQQQPLWTCHSAPSTILDILVTPKETNKW